MEIADSHIKAVLARHPLVSYFLIAFAFSWLLFLPGPLMYYGVLNLNPSVLGVLGIAGLLGPIFSGFVMTATTEGRADPGPWGHSTSPPSRSPWPTLLPSSPWSSSGDRCSRNRGGQASLSPACSGCTGHW